MALAGMLFICFNTCSSCEEQHPGYCRLTHNRGFNTCSSCEEQPQITTNKSIFLVSIHAPLARSNEAVCNLFHAEHSFNTCSSCEEQHRAPAGSEQCCRFNTCSSCAEQRNHARAGRQGNCFNTCSSCEEQLERSLATWECRCFNTCSSCEEQLIVVGLMIWIFKFQYMLLLRGATKHLNRELSLQRFQYMLLLRGATGVI